MNLDSSPRRPRSLSLLSVAGIVAFNLALWGRTIGYGFVFDDLINILANSWIRDWHAVAAAFTHQAAGFDPRLQTSFYRPFMHVFYAAAYSVAGTQPWAYHLLNVAIQAVAAICVYYLSRLLCLRWFGPARVAGLAFVAALVFSAHPVHTEAVAWIAGITDLSYSVFGLLAFIAYIRAVDSGPNLWPGALLLVSVLSKETGVAFLFLMVVFEWIESNRDQRWSVGSAAKRLAPPILSVGIYMVMRMSALGSFAPSARQHPHTATELLAAGFGLFARYLGTLVWPVDLNVMRTVHVDRGFSDPAATVGVILGCALIGLAVRYRRVPLLVLSIAVVVLPILPTLYVPAVESGGSVFGERYLYLPALGVAWLIGFPAAELAQRAAWNRVAVVTALAVLMCCCSFAVFARSQVWINSLSLWTDAARKSPDSAAAQEGLCYALLSDSRIQEAIRACDRAIAIDAARVDARINRANALLAVRRPEEALRELDAAIALRFNSFEAHTSLGLAYMALGRVDEALDSYRQALAINPDYAEGHNDLGVALVRASRPAEARPHLEEAVRLAPDNLDYRSNLQACPR